MLTKKQIWRRVKARSSNVLEYYTPPNIKKNYEKDSSKFKFVIPFFTSESDDTITFSESNDLSNQSISSLSNTSSFNSLASFSIVESSDNLFGEITIQKAIKSVKFSPKVRVCLVPSRVELTPIMDKLYWNQNEYALFKQEAILEIREALLTMKSPNGSSLTPKDAQISLYQPDLRETIACPDLLVIPNIKCDIIDCNDEIKKISDELKKNMKLSSVENKLETIIESNVKTTHHNNVVEKSQQFKITTYQTVSSQSFQNNGESDSKKYEHKQVDEYYESEKLFENEVDALTAAQSLDKCLSTIRRRDSVQLFKMYQSDSQLESDIEELINRNMNQSYEYNVSAICIS